MRRPSFYGITVLLALFLTAGLTANAQAQDKASGQDELKTYAKAFVAIGKVRDQMQAELADIKNKKDEAQAQLHEKMRVQIANVLKEHGLTQQQYNHITYMVSTEPEMRKAFDLILGVAPPGPPPTATAAAPMAANPHVGHVTTSFNGTPNAQGLLPTALAEARVVVQHAALAMRSTANLDAMKTHAAHVLHAVEPAEGTTGPGAGYGLKKAAAGVAQHVDLAAKAQGATANVTTHSVHIVASAKNTVSRADEIITLAKQIQAATSVADAAALVTKLNAVATQLLEGVDANGDGRISWDAGEGGLQHVEQHVGLMTRG